LLTLSPPASKGPSFVDYRIIDYPVNERTTPHL
jgi:hypothetical protein